MRQYLALLALLCLSAPLSAQTVDQYRGWDTAKGFDTTGLEGAEHWIETDWSEWLATQLDGEHTATTHSGCFVDVLTDEAIEVEWADKWKEAPGQSLLYEIETKRPAAIILLCGPDDKVAILRCQAVCIRAGIRLYVQRVPQPERNQIAPMPKPRKQLIGPQTAIPFPHHVRRMI